MIERYVSLCIDPFTMHGWTKNDMGQWAYCRDGKALTGQQTIDGAAYLFGSDGTLMTG